MSAAHGSIFGKTAFKVGSAVALMGLSTVGAILIAFLVFSSFSQQIDVLSTRTVPQLAASSEVVDQSSKLKDGFTELVLADDPEELKEAFDTASGMIDGFEAAVASLPPETSAQLEAVTAAMRSSLTQLFETRQREFETSRDINFAVADLVNLDRFIAAELNNLSKLGQVQMQYGALNTINMIDETLRTLVERDFSSLRVALEVQADLNAITGAVVALSALSDPQLRDDITALALRALEDYESNLPQLLQIGDIDPVPLQTMLLVAKSSLANNISRRPDQLMRLRDQSEEAITATITTLTASLVELTAEASKKNSTQIQSLLDGEVQRILSLDKLATDLANFVSAGLSGAQGSTPAQLEAAQKDMEARAATLSERIKATSPTLSARADQLAAFAEPGAGIVAKRRDMLADRRSAIEASRSAAQKLLTAAQTAMTVSARSIDDIETAASALSRHIASARNQMIGIAVAAVVLLVLVQVGVRITLVKPLQAVAASTRKLSSGDLSALDHAPKSGGEIGEMVSALEIFRDNIRKNEELEEKARAQAEDQAEVVRHLAAGLGKLRDGDLTYQITAHFPDHYEKLRSDFNLAVDNLGRTIATIADSARLVMETAGEISSAATAIARRTETSAASLEETAAALEELTASVKSASLQADESGRIVLKTRSNAEKSGEVVQAAVSAMQRIVQSSEGVSRIVDVIDDIAFQTNLLALNAGVEAARAGETGRGFAVVASEVRELAQRSANAAKEIGDLIAESSGHVRNGVDLVTQTGDFLQDLILSINTVSDNVLGIANAAREQSSGLGEINNATSNLDRATQQNAASYEETTAATTALSNEAKTLFGEVTKFKLPQGVQLAGGSWVDEAPRPAANFGNVA